MTTPALTARATESYNCFSWQHLTAALHANGITIKHSDNGVSTPPHHSHPLTWIKKHPLYDNQNAIINLDVIHHAIAQHSKVEYHLLKAEELHFYTFYPYIHSDYLSKQRILPLSLNKNSVVFISDNPYDSSWHPTIEHIFDRALTVFFTDPESLSNGLIQWQRFAESQKLAIEAAPSEHNLERLETSSSAIEVSNWLWHYAFLHRASDIHLEPKEDYGLIRMRIDGTMQTIQHLNHHIFYALISHLKVLAGVDIIEKNKPQDGRIKLRAPHHSELRLATLPSLFGEKCVLRIFDANIANMSAQHLGFSAQQQQLWHDLCRQQSGLILVCGPTGSGKTTTLYSTLKSLAKPDINICTIEDPIEMVIDAFNQTQVNPHVALSFASGLRALLRMDPDIIMVGEIRDSETAQIAVQAALTGHLVFSTVHTHTAQAAVTRLKDLGVSDYLLDSTLRGVLAQRLLRTLCNSCKTTLEGAQPYTFNASGCSHCKHSGYNGRSAIFELLTEFDTNRSTPSLYPLWQAGLEVYQQGLTDHAELERVLGPAPESLKSYLNI